MQEAGREQAASRNAAAAREEAHLAASLAETRDVAALTAQVMDALQDVGAVREHADTRLAHVEAGVQEVGREQAASRAAAAERLRVRVPADYS